MLIHILEIADEGHKKLGSTNMPVAPQLGSLLVIPPSADHPEHRRFFVQQVAYEVRLLPKEYLGEIREVLIEVRNRPTPNYEEDEPTLSAADAALRDGESDVAIVYVVPAEEEPPNPS